MKQLIARIPEELHDRLRQRAEALGCSMNTLVRSILHTALGRDRLDDATELRTRLKAAGLLREPQRQQGPVPAHEKVIASTKGAGRVASEALEAERAGR